MLQAIVKATGYLDDFSEFYVIKKQNSQYVVCYISVGRDEGLTLSSVVAILAKHFCLSAEGLTFLLHTVTVSYTKKQDHEITDVQFYKNRHQRQVSGLNVPFLSRLQRLTGLNDVVIL